jgi:cell division septum initiation protein DivIVA
MATANSDDVMRLIDMIYERIDSAKAAALKPGMCTVERDELLDLLDELRAQLPIELKRAQELIAARDKFVEDAKRDVDSDAPSGGAGRQNQGVREQGHVRRTGEGAVKSWPTPRIVPARCIR